jgi:hypothetical protein
MSNRIRWEPIEHGGWTGHVGTFADWLFQIWDAASVGGVWQLDSTLPGDWRRIAASADPDELKAEAERWLSEFVVSLGAVFPSATADEIVRWQDVRTGDSVLLDAEMVTAEKVNVVQKPWGDGTTFAAADIYHRLDNGVLVSSERHGDRYTAIRHAARTERQP